jgi:nitroreductase
MTFPAPPLSEVEFIAAVELATRAPSLHNSQPWRFRRTSDTTIELRTDPDRALPVADPAGHAARIACGAALLNLRLGLAAVNRPSRVELLPDRDDPTLLARLTLAAAGPPTNEDRALAAAIPRRRSQRNPFVDAVVPFMHRGAMEGAAAREASVLVFLTEAGEVADLADLVHTANATLNRRPGYLDELRSWIHPDGVPQHAAGPAPALHELLERRDYGGDPAPEHRRYEDRPLVAVLASFGDSHWAQLKAGQALQRVLLTATRLGLAASMLSQPIEVAAPRQRLGAMIGRLAVPQMVLRIGFGVPGRATPRRPARDVIELSTAIR